jgi:hypothetical protein
VPNRMTFLLSLGFGAMHSVKVLLGLLEDDGGNGGRLPPGSPPTCKIVNFLNIYHEMLTAMCRQIRRPLVLYAAFAFIDHRNHLLSDVFVL